MAMKTVRIHHFYLNTPKQHSKPQRCALTGLFAALRAQPIAWVGGQKRYIEPYPFVLKMRRNARIYNHAN